MHRQHEQAAVPPHPVQLSPSIARARATGDGRCRGRCAGPGGTRTDSSRPAPSAAEARPGPAGGLENVRAVVVHQARVVGKAVLGEQIEGATARLPARRPVAQRRHAQPVERARARARGRPAPPPRPSAGGCGGCIRDGRSPGPRRRSARRPRDSGRPCSRGRRTWPGASTPRAVARMRGTATCGPYAWWLISIGSFGIPPSLRRGSATPRPRRS